LVTFDDCYCDFLSCALPILLRYNIKALAFPVSRLIGGDNVWDNRLGAPKLQLLDAADLLHIQSKGIAIGSHTRTHSRLIDLSEPDLIGEIKGSLEDLTALGLKPLPVLAYPYGIFNENVKKVAQSCGIQAALTVHPGVVEGKSDPFEIPRIEILPTDEGTGFLEKVAHLRVAKKTVALRARGRDPEERDPTKLSDVTLVVLSCARYDLLDATVRSFFRINEYPIREVLISEDSGDPDALGHLESIFKPYNIDVTFFVRSSRQGINACMDVLYSRVQTEFVLHLEDDWLCTSTSGDFIERAKEVLSTDDNILQVWLRPPYDCNGHPLDDDILGSLHARYRLLKTGYRGKWHGYSNNPNLRRKREYLLLGAGGYTSMARENSAASEVAINQFYLERGLRAAVLVEPDAGFIHIGGARSIASTFHGPRTSWSSPPSVRELHAELSHALERNQALTSELRQLHERLEKSSKELQMALGPPPAVFSDLSRLQLLAVDGMGRSGSSALVRAIASRSDVAPTPEGGAPLISSFVDFLVSYDDDSPNRDYHRNRYKVSLEERYALFRSVLYRVATGVDPTTIRDPRIKYVVAKTWPSPSTICRFLELFPGMCHFYIIRNGIEVVASTMRFLPMSAITFEQVCIDWAEGIEVDEPLLATCALIRHEQLVSDPDATFLSAFERLGLPPDPAPAKFISNELFNSSFNKPSSGVPVRDIFAARPSPWLQWSPKERETFRSICGRTMEKLGYSIPEGA
jgi:hypothetical protein